MKVMTVSLFPCPFSRKERREVRECRLRDFHINRQDRAHAGRTTDRSWLRTIYPYSLPQGRVGNSKCGATPAPTSLRGGAADAAIQFHPLTISHRIDIVSTRKAKPLDCRIGFASSQ